MGVPAAGGSCRVALAPATAAQFLLLLLCGCGATAAMAAAAGGGGGGERYDGARYKDPRQPLNRRIDDLLGRMTIAEKIGQMSQIERENATANVVRGYFVGSVLSGGGSVPAPQAPAEAWVDMVNGMQRAAMSTRLGIPMLYGIDAVHGHGNVYKATVFPHNVGLGCTRDPELVKKIGAAVALEVRATGIPYVFAPCVAVCRDPRWGRCYESFSEDPKVVQEMTSIIPGLQGEIPANGRRGAPFVAGQRNVAACSKHYVGDGGTTKGINENNTVASFHELLGVHMPPYYSAVIQGVSTVMVSFSSWNGVKMHANHFLVTDFLKNTLRFRGFVISDWRAFDKMTSPEHADYITSIKLGILAGIDMVMIPYTYTEFIDDLTTLVQNGTIPMSRIDDAVRRILRVKFTMGLFENPYGDPSLAGELGKPEHRELARVAVRRSLVLLKNGKDGEKPLLPLPKKARSILVAGSHADNLGYQCGGWTITWQGLGGNNLTTGTTILDGIKRAVDHGMEVVYSENPDAGFVQQNKGRFDYAVVVVGEPPYAESFGDNLNLTIPAPGPSVIRNVCGSVRCAVVLVSGRPLVVEPFMGAVDALVAAWLPGTEGQGVSDLLFGDYGFTGKLARTWFRSVEQLPMNVGDAHYDPLFPYGFGLETQPSTA
ncbi:Beta-glucosidase BoGH3B [Dichanthelium oligosanthes]|uniref:Beta-glucosidase BoGH3B n=1 Tax=Dichanthelium oligosanthes TaxID=888268 RepID=A0A1E5VIX7_9POAL|nr:Beta-glucosidase BoGH3B [Dichanthelium oligosanthes]